MWHIYSADIYIYIFPKWINHTDTADIAFQEDYDSINDINICICLCKLYIHHWWKKKNCPPLRLSPCCLIVGSHHKYNWLCERRRLEREKEQDPYTPLLNWNTQKYIGINDQSILRWTIVSRIRTSQEIK